jgi:aryl-alcohol dehydrogenase-like predicted oxidoreductase
MSSAPTLATFRPRNSVDEPLPLVLGTMNFGKRTPEPEARRIIDRAIERGVTLFDTANAYADGEGERILGRALAGRRDRALVASKVGLSRIGGEVSGLIRAGGRSEGLSRRRILEACDETLSRLGMDHVDVYYLHVPDRETPTEESLGAIAELLRAGKIRAWASSNYASWQLVEMILWCDREGVARPVMAQQLYNLLVRQLDVEYLAFAAKYGHHLSVYNPLAGGLLTEREQGPDPVPGSRFDANPMYQRRYFTGRLRDNAADYRALAKDLGMTLVELAYAWLASRPSVGSIVVGPGTTAHLDAAVDACTRRLDPATMQRIDELYRAQQGTDAVYARI